LFLMNHSSYSLLYFSKDSIFAIIKPLFQYCVMCDVLYNYKKLLFGCAGRLSLFVSILPFQSSWRIINLCSKDFKDDIKRSSALLELLDDRPKIPELFLKSPLWDELWIKNLNIHKQLRFSRLRVSYAWI